MLSRDNKSKSKNLKKKKEKQAEEMERRMMFGLTGVENMSVDSQVVDRRGAEPLLSAPDSS